MYIIEKSQGGDSKMTHKQNEINPSDEIRKFQRQIDDILNAISSASLYSDPSTKSEMHILLKDLQTASEKMDILSSMVESCTTTDINNSIKAE